MKWSGGESVTSSVACGVTLSHDRCSPPPSLSPSPAWGFVLSHDWLTAACWVAMLTVCTCSRKTQSSSNTTSRRLTHTLSFRQYNSNGHISLVSFLSGCFKSLCEGLEQTMNVSESSLNASRLWGGSESGLVVTYCDQRGAVFFHSSQNRSLRPKPAANQSSRLSWRVFISEAFNNNNSQVIQLLP